MTFIINYVIMVTSKQPIKYIAMSDLTGVQKFVIIILILIFAKFIFGLIIAGIVLMFAWVFLNPLFVICVLIAFLLYKNNR